MLRALSLSSITTCPSPWAYARSIQTNAMLVHILFFLLAVGHFFSPFLFSNHILFSLLNCKRGHLNGYAMDSHHFITHTIFSGTSWNFPRRDFSKLNWIDILQYQGKKETIWMLFKLWGKIAMFRRNGDIWPREREKEKRYQHHHYYYDYYNNNKMNKQK